jgi:hypothetical protein
MNNIKQHADKLKEPDKFNFEKNSQLTEVFKRNNYFYGKLMTVSDLELEQRYFNNKRHLINRFVHGTGIVCGLEVSRISKISEKPEKQKNSPERWSITITNGFALDCCGREIVFVSKGEIQDYVLNIEQDYPPVYKDYNDHYKQIGLYLRQLDHESDPILSPSPSSSCDTMECNSHIEEQYQIFPEVFAAIKFDKLSYKVGGTATITLIDQETELKEVPVNVTSSANKDGIKITLERKDKNSPFTGQFKLSEQDKYGSSGTLKVDGNGDLVEVKYVYVSSGLQIKESCRVFPSKDKDCHGLDGFKNLLGECTYCTNEVVSDGPPKVLLAVIRRKNNPANEGYPEIDPDTWKYRKIVYNNALLYELLNHNNKILHDLLTGVTISQNYLIEKGDDITHDERGRSQRAAEKATYNISEKIYYQEDRQPLARVPPSITLGKEEDQTEVQSTQRKIDYMEDLGSLKLHYAKNITPGKIPKDAPKWVEEYFASKNEPVLFEAIDIDTRGFRILSIWPANPISTNMNIRWWANFAVDTTQLLKSLGQM